MDRLSCAHWRPLLQRESKAIENGEDAESKFRGVDVSADEMMRGRI